MSGCEESCSRSWAALRRPAHPDDDAAQAPAGGDGAATAVCAGESPLSRLVLDALRFEMQVAALPAGLYAPIHPSSHHNTSKCPHCPPPAPQLPYLIHGFSPPLPPPL